MLREGSLIRGTKVKEARVGQEGTLLAPIPGKRALRKNNLPLRGLYGNLCPQRMPQSKEVRGAGAGSERRLQVEGMSRPSWFQGLRGMACAKGKGWQVGPGVGITECGGQFRGDWGDVDFNSDGGVWIM